MRQTILGAILGALATTLVGLLTPAASWLGERYVQANSKAVFNSLDTRVYAGAPTSSNTNYSAKCLGDNELLIGGFCRINHEGGALQNAGVDVDGKNYVCVYGAKADATAFALCLRRK
ncbi:MAG: hypothetical protein JOY71_23350 [Acetobacteraceae bacterium]|nr:hypothetical protein [Acetobacteraceae bacterium]MBV8525020.1 hypothetical protein [Acetobacteraceae bacterium]